MSEETTNKDNNGVKPRTGFEFKLRLLFGKYIYNIEVNAIKESEVVNAENYHWIRW